MGFTFTDLTCLALSTGTGVYFLLKSNYAYSKKTMNVYTYLMHILLAFALFGKLIKILIFLSQSGLYSF